MVEFKAVIADPKDGRTYQTDVTGHHANSLIGKVIGDEFDGIFVALPGYKLRITGGSDKDGIPMRKDLEGSRRQRVLVSYSIGFRPKHRGQRRRKFFYGRQVSPSIYQINMKVVSHGSKPIPDLLKSEEESK